MLELTLNTCGQGLRFCVVVTASEDACHNNEWIEPLTSREGAIDAVPGIRIIYLRIKVDPGRLADSSMDPQNN